MSKLKRNPLWEGLTNLMNKYVHTRQLLSKIYDWDQDLQDSMRVRFRRAPLI